MLPETEQEVAVTEQDQVPAKSKRNESLERENKDIRSILVYSGIFLSLDVWRQIASYGIRYYNNGTYALPQTLLVALAEVTKLLLCGTWLLVKGELGSIKISYLYAIPAVFYAVNSNIYYVGLRYTTPPLWNIFNQQRMFLIALIYRIRFRQTIPVQRWLGLAVIAAGIITIGSNRGLSAASGGDVLAAFVWAMCGSVVSAIGSIVVEYLMKNDSRSFVEMQFQFYLFGLLAALGLAGAEAFQNPYNIAEVVDKWEKPTLLATLVVICVLLSATSGVATGVIVKKLDNIVKLYTQALSNILTSIACAYFYPDMFTFDFIFLISLLLIFIGITLYENKTQFNVTEACISVKNLCLLGI